jgi:hypothetical protein
MKRFTYEILEKIENASSKEERKKILAENDSAWFRTYLKCAFDPNIQFYAEKFPDQYKEPKDVLPGISYSDIQSEIKRVYLFQKGHPTADSLTESKRNILLIQMLEMFEPREAVAFFKMLTKDLKTKGLTYKLVEETFPGLLP